MGVYVSKPGENIGDVLRKIQKDQETAEKESLRDFMRGIVGQDMLEEIDPEAGDYKKHSKRLAAYGDRESIQNLIRKVEESRGGNENSWIYGTDVQKDLKKVRFGKSNIDSGWGELDAPGFKSGFDELKEGLTVVWAVACGRGEWPVAFCLYEDNHKHLRAYIPEEGNVFDKKRKCAYNKNIRSYKYDMKKLRKAALDRIALDPNTKPKKEQQDETSAIPSGTEITLGDIMNAPNNGGTVFVPVAPCN